MFNTISNWIEAKHHALAARAIDVWVQKKGQGTTEYAILVGVLVGHRDHCHHALPPQDPRTLGCHLERDQRALGQTLLT